MSADPSPLQQIRQGVGAVARRVSERLAESSAADHEAEKDSTTSAKKKAAPSEKQHFFDPEPTIAIIVPAHNEDRFLRPCLRSIREQYFNSWECIIIDDGSTDQTREIADEYAARDSRFRVVSHTKSLGLAAARNSGIELTKAPYLTFLDADDFLYQHSLNSRLNALLAATEDNVAGSYCDWQPTREREGRTPPTRPAADKPQVVGFPGGPECPFIATAPLIRREVVEQLGGFNEALPTAEDFDLWIRVLRHGYTFVYADKIGVAYRQKASGMVFTDTALHASASDDIIAWQYEDLTGVDEEMVFARPLSSYARDVVQAKRLLRSFALSEAVAESDDQEQIGRMLPESLPLLAKTGLDVRFELNAGLARAARAVPSLNDPEIRRRTLEALLGRVLDAPTSTGPARSARSAAGASGSLASSSRAEHRSLAPTRNVQASKPAVTKTELGVLLVPMARYHALEMQSLADALRERGVDSTFLIVDDFADKFHDVLVASDRIDFDGDPSALASFSGIYMMNDWGMTRELIREARIRNVPTFARVEGVQDYRDVDTGRIRLPYQTADHVFAQGDNDVAALNHTKVTVVGNGRLEDLHARPERTSSSATGRVVINSNFTYGVFTELRDTYVESAIRACLDADLVPLISQHPADAPLPATLMRYRSDTSMSELLHECDVLVSRFSTVPFEAMAIGTPFVYFRPQAERVATFDNGDAAFETVYASAQLAEALVRAVALLGSYRARSDAFFRSQIDITAEPSDRRAAEAIASTIARWGVSDGTA